MGDVDLEHLSFRLTDKQEMRRVTIADLDVKSEHMVKNMGKYGVYLKLHNKDIDKGTIIYRYIKVEYLNKTIREGKLFVPNIQKFEDVRETKGLREAIKDIPELRPIPNHWMRQYKNRIMRTLNLCALCWTTDNRLNGLPDESFLMWKFYSLQKSNISEGEKALYRIEPYCRIETTIGKLIESLVAKTHDIVISDVIYGETHELNDYEYLLFRKSIYFEQEQEIRMAVLSKNPKGTLLKVNVEKLLEDADIIVSPFALKDDKNIEELRKLCETIKGVKVIPSNILLNIDGAYNEKYASFLR